VGLTFQGHTQTTLKEGKVRTIVNNGDTLIVMSVADAKKILIDVLDYEILDSLYQEYKFKDSLNTKRLGMKDSIIVKLNKQIVIKDEIIFNKDSIIDNTNETVKIKDEIIADKDREIGKQKRLKSLGFIGCVVLPILVLFGLR
jgi:hypothetical protein